MLNEPLSVSLRPSTCYRGQLPCPSPLSHSAAQGDQDPVLVCQITIRIYPSGPSVSVSVSLYRHSHLISTEVAFPLPFKPSSKEDKEADK